MRAAAARAIALRAFGQRRSELRMRGEAQIVVAGETDDGAAVDGHMGRAGAVGDAPLAAQPVRGEVVEALGERVEQLHQRSPPTVASNVSSVRAASSASSASSSTYGGIR